MYRWHFDNSETEAIVYAETQAIARQLLMNIFPNPDEAGFKLIGVEEMLSLEEKIG